MTDAFKGDFGILGFQLPPRVGADGGAIAERVAEQQARAIIIEISAEVSGERIASRFPAQKAPLCLGWRAWEATGCGRIAY